ncbi:hypothetical protein [Flagellimonas sp.]|uniref:hypothetical protein n=1 Tax=Flagellimonas sp. TaxID=2058762 RepID=UPI003BAB8D3E
MKSIFMGLVCVMVLSFACNNPSSKITGEYSYRENGLPTYVVSETANGYSLTFKTTKQEWSEPKDFVPVDQETIVKIFGQKSKSVNNGFFWESVRGNKTYIFSVDTDSDSDLFSTGFIYRKEFNRTNITEKLYKL